MASHEQDPGFLAAVEEAKKGYEEGGVPIGACLVSANGEILGRGHNMRFQNDSATQHAEMAALENAGRLPASAYKNATMYTTLSPCQMCSGALTLFKVNNIAFNYIPSTNRVKVKRVVIGENDNYLGGEEDLKKRGREVEVLRHKGCKELMAKFLKEKPELWCVETFYLLDCLHIYHFLSAVFLSSGTGC